MKGLFAIEAIEATVNVNAANDVYMRSLRERRRTDAPIARIKSAASSAVTAWTSTGPV